MLETLSLPFFQRGLIEILILAIPAGLVGSWIVLRGLAFFSHAIGTASFPGLVAADGLGLPASVGAFGAAGLFAAFTALLGRIRRTSSDSITAMVLVGSLAAGVILASDVFGSTASVDSMLFGSLLSIGTADIVLAAGAAVLALLATVFFGHHWLARGFDEGTSGSRPSAALLDAVLLLTVAVTVTASLSAVGALLISVLIVVPAATVRLVATRLRTQLLGSVALVAVQGSLGLWLSFETDAPPGATIAVVSGFSFLAVLVGRAVKRRGRALAAVAALATAGLIAGCGGDGSTGSGLKVVATTTQVGDIVKQVGGDEVNLSILLKPNTDPHDYEPRPSDVKAVADAELLFRSGGHLDEWVEEVVADSGSETRIIDLSQNLPSELEGSEDHAHDHGEDEHDHGEDEHDHGDEQHDHGEEDHDHGEIDPHWWHDPVNVRAAAQAVATGLSEADRNEAGHFADNAAAFTQEINQLHQQIAKCVRSVPASDRKIVTDHDVFAYFTSRYDIHTAGTVIPALTTRAEPSAGDLADLEKAIRQEQVKAIFSENSLPPDLAEAIGRDTGASTRYTLYGDSLGPQGSVGETWLGMMKANTDNLMLGMTSGSRDCFGVAG